MIQYTLEPQDGAHYFQKLAKTNVIQQKCNHQILEPQS